MNPVIELAKVKKMFGSVIALDGVSFDVLPGEVHCLLGDNGAGKSTLIKVLSGVHQPTQGAIRINGQDILFQSPRDAYQAGVATVFQDLAMLPLMSIARNFFLGREPTKGKGLLRRFDARFADEVTRQEMVQIGIDIRDPGQAVGTLSGGERQGLAIARATYFGARVLILDEPTSALGVHQASMVLKYIDKARDDGIGVVFITHNINHAYPIGDRFTLLNRGTSHGTFRKSDITRDEILRVMAGGEEMHTLREKPPGVEV
ncbi:ATP-binding cassette domain-containing protein [Paraburkholderia sp. BL10I2N1]|uniref:ATP-binding cassette domain-containing protein n=1 Tax=Paraburkholderia sp. BL10I2N1 TaxID=1938796 RepID=UPI00105ECF13|nr:ATP-binding cassette domain-containing protein [Paraburkholderia sp. BL10I2N1]TDN63171.1 monosaccharide ABC transporter ATP-binding protein (CUT2 family) [Paraburkholderia sp. BL10I2N1]